MLKCLFIAVNKHTNFISVYHYTSNNLAELPKRP